MNYSLSELETLFEKINNIISYVEGSNLQDRRTTLFLSNGSSITYSVPNTSVPHLLGIDTNYLISTGYFRATNAFDVLKELVESPYKIFKLKTEGHIDYKRLFSEYIEEKINSFKENIKINLYDTEFICEYNKERSFYTSEINENCDYIIVKKYENDSIGIIYLAKNNWKCIPMSNRIFKNLDEAQPFLAELLKGQEICFLNGDTSYNTYSDYKKSYYLPLNAKTEKLNELKKYANMFNCSLNITDDYEHILDKLTSNRQTFQENDSIIKTIVTSIVNGQLIDRNLYIDSKLLSIIDACNDIICKYNISSDDGENTYTTVITKLKEAEQTILTLEEKNNALEAEVSELTETNNTLQTEVSESREKEKQILKILKPEN